MIPHNEPKGTLILLVMTWRRTGGLEAVTMDIASAFAVLGWQVKVLAIFDNFSKVVTPNVEAVGLYPQNSLRQLIWNLYLWRVIVAKRIRSMITGKVHVIIAHPHLLPIIDHLPQQIATSSWAWTYGIDVWGNQALRWASWLKLVKRVVAISSFTANEIHRVGKNLDISVVPCCVDINHFSPTATPELIRRSEILICGRMAASERYKGHDVLLESIPLVEAELGREVTLRVVGTGDDLDRLRSKSYQLGLANKVIFTGRLSDDQLLDAYRHCGVFCMPSRVDRRETQYWSGEGFGIVYIEAAACGRPVIASTDGGAPETIVSGETGILVDPRSPKEVAHSIVEILQNSALADEMGYRGRKLVEQRFSFDRFVQTIDQLIQVDLLDAV